MEKFGKACVLDIKCSKRSYVLTKISTCPKPKFNNKIKELRLSQFLHLDVRFEYNLLVVNRQAPGLSGSHLQQ